jgi:predicted nucleotidyltransferase
MNLPQDVAGMLEALLASLQAELGATLVGVYLRGSLALGDFIPTTSDIDVLVIVEEPVTEAAFTKLVALHTDLAALPNPYANRLEIAYLDRVALRRFVPGQVHPTLGQGETLTWSEHRDNWILERWTVREHGVALLGPAPQTLIDPIPAEEIRRAVRVRLRDWAAWANQPDDPDWRLPRSHKAYVVETMCRALYTLACGALCTKPQAVAWALATLSEPWRSTVERAQAWRTDPTLDPALVPEVRRFVQWATADDIDGSIPC